MLYTPLFDKNPTNNRASFTHRRAFPGSFRPLGEIETTHTEDDIASLVGQQAEVSRRERSLRSASVDV